MAPVQSFLSPAHNLNFFPSGQIFVCLFVCCSIHFHVRAKWFELMNTEEEEVDEEERRKRKREQGLEENPVKVKKIKLKVAKW